MEILVKIIKILEGIIAALKGTIVALGGENKILKERISELERKLGLNSQTSSKPPTSDGLQKQTRKPISLRGQGKLKGGQKLHKGKSMQQIPNPDKIIIHQVKNCCQCGSKLIQAPIEKLIKRQVCDVSIERVVTEHQAEVKRCHCKALTTAFFPQEVKGPVQIGEQLQATILYLSEQFIAKDRLSQVVEDLFGIPVSDTTIYKYETQLAKNLLLFSEDSLSYLKKTEVKHGDETGIRVGGKTEWIHVLSDRFVTSLWQEKGRKCKLTDIEGFYVHDFYKSYLQLDSSGLTHGFCNAHILRELKALVEYDKELWAHQMARLLRSMSHSKNTDALTPSKVARYNRLYDQIVAQGLSYHESLPSLKKPSTGRQKRRTGHNLLIRLRDFKEGILLFLTNRSVPFTNNQAEQDLRMVKVKQKVSGCFRTQEGLKNFTRIRSYLGTIRKNRGNILDGIKKALKEEIRLWQVFNPQLINQLSLSPPG
jgi:transposase